MSDQERTGVRDLAFSGWHRAALSKDCTAIDLDFCEYCRVCRKPLALIEIAKGHHDKIKPTTVMAALAQRADLRAYLILYDLDPDDEFGLSTVFRVSRIHPCRKTFGAFHRDVVARMFERLHRECSCRSDAR